MRFGSLDLFENTTQGSLGIPTDHGLPIGQGPDVPLIWTNAPTNGQILIGSSGNDPVLANLNAGANITISNGPGSITISAAGSTGFVWQTISSNMGLTVNQGYICTGGGVLILTLPVGSLGDLIEITLDGSAGWSLQTGATTIRIGSNVAGPGGALTSSGEGDSVRLLSQGSNRWNVISSIGNITIS